MGHSSGHLKRPPRRFQVQRPSEAGACRDHPALRSAAGAGHPADIRPQPTGQGKGRADAETFEDRLATELRLAGASNIKQANEVLQEFLPRFSALFPVATEQTMTAYRPLPDKLSQTETICLKDTCKGPGNTVKYQWQVL